MFPFTRRTSFRVKEGIATLRSGNARSRRRQRTASARSSLDRAVCEVLEWRVLLSNSIVFSTPANLPEPAGASNPYTIVTGDFNKDGKLDIAAPNIGSGNATVWLNNGNGAFVPTNYAVTGSPTSMAVGDFNNDGWPDLVTTNYGGSYGTTVSVLLNKGDGTGTFNSAINSTTISGPISVATGDFNGDGNLDLVTANYGAGPYVTVMYGNGTGNFTEHAILTVGAGPYWVTTADLNNDGRPDIITADHIGDTISVLLSTGPGTFASDHTYATGGATDHVTVADLNSDGVPDLVATDENGTVAVALGNGNGTFQTPTIYSVGGSTTQADSATVADFNGDGIPDIAVSAQGTNQVNILPGLGNGTFAPAVSFSLPTGGHTPHFVVAADMNNDGRPDLVTANYGLNSASVLFNTGLFPLASVVSINRTTPAGPTTGLSSVNYTVTFSKNVTGVVASDFALALTGSAAATTPVVVTPVSGSVYTVTVNGIHGSGMIGLNFVDNGSVHDLAGNPLQGGGTASFQTQATFATGSRPNSVTSADVNGDGKADLLVANSSSSVSVLLGNGNGTFQTQAT
jgi:hypothetical protein